MTHLGDMAAALVDNELSHDQRDRALSHLAHCDECRAEVDAQRRLKALLTNQPDPAPSPDLAARLLGVAAGARPDVVRGATRGPVRPRRRLVMSRPRPSRTAVAGGLSALALTVAASLALGGESTAPRVRPPVATFVDDHAATTVRLGQPNDPAGTVVLTSFGP